ncbi:hypothetical protein GCM10028857_12710 [Salinarchaeum chitinilyticum]
MLEDDRDEANDSAVSDDADDTADGQSADFVEGRFEASPHEPDPPSFDVTTGEDLVDDLPSGSEVSSDVRRSFWEMVVLLKIALLSLSLGIMLAYFQGRIALAAGLGLVTAVASVRLLWRVRSFDGDGADG